MGTKSLFYLLVRTQPLVGALIARVTLGVCMLPHGVQKLQKFSATMDSFTQQSGIPAPLAFLVVMAESFGAVGLILGVIGRFCAFGIACVMAGAIALVHGKNGFSAANKGYEYNLALLGIALAVMVMGSGALSFDRWMTKRLERPKE